MKLVSVVIPAYNSESTIGYVLDSIAKQDYPSVEVIIVDNGSTDKTSLVVSQYREIFKERGYYIKYIRYDKPLGHAPAINIGIREALGQYILILHSDIMLCSSNWISTIVKILENNDKVAVVSSLLVTEPEKLAFIDRAFSYIYILGWHKENVNLKTMTVPYTGLNNDLIRSDVFNEVGFLDESYRYGMHDIDFSEKVRRKGYLIILEPSVCAKHMLSYEQRSLGGHLRKAWQYGYPSGIILKRYRYLPNLDNTLFALSILLGPLLLPKIPLIYPLLFMSTMLALSFFLEPRNFYGKNKYILRLKKNAANIAVGLLGFLVSKPLLVVGLGSGVPLYRALVSSYNAFRDLHDAKLSLFVFMMSIIWYFINGVAVIAGLFTWPFKAR